MYQGFGMITLFLRHIKLHPRTCHQLAANGHLDALKYLQMELMCDWKPLKVLLEAASNGHVHVLQWAVENGAPLVLPYAEETHALHTLLVARICNKGFVPALEWLLAMHPTILDHLDLDDLVPLGSVRVIEILASRFGTAQVMAKLLPRLGDHREDHRFAMMDWCIKQGTHLDADYYERAMLTVAFFLCDVPRTEQLLQLGGVWYANFFHNALVRNKLAFCQWAHKRGDLELGLEYIDNLRVYSTEALAWLASVGVFLRVTENDTFRRLARLDTGQLPYIIEHYPRYVFY